MLSTKKVEFIKFSQLQIETKLFYDVTIIRLEIKDFGISPVKKMVIRELMKLLTKQLKIGRAIKSLVEKYGLNFDDACDIQLMYNEHYKSKDPKPIVLEFVYENGFVISNSITNNKRTRVGVKPKSIGVNPFE